MRRNNFAVFEDGVRQHHLTVEIEHAPVTLAVLLDMGGRSPLRITDASGRRVQVRVLAEATYTPSTLSTRTSG